MDEQDLFLDAADLDGRGLRVTQDGPGLMKVWTTPDPDARIQRVVDIRWVFDDDEAAADGHRAQLAEQSEGGAEIDLPRRDLIGEDLHVYAFDGGNTLLAGLGLDLKMYIFLFRVGNVAAKVFVSGSGLLGIDEATSLATRAEERIRDAVE